MKETDGFVDGQTQTTEDDAEYWEMVANGSVVASEDELELLAHPISQISGGNE